MKKVLIIIIAILFVALLIAAAIFMNQKTAEIMNTNESSKSGETNTIENETEPEENNQVAEEVEEGLIELTSENFEELVLNGEGRILVDCYADWCYWCTVLEPILEEVVSERDDITLYRLNVDNEEELASKYHVYGLPTVLLFENGENVDGFSGAMPKENVEQFLDGEEDSGESLYKS
jgi:thioredoxin 1